MLENKYSKICVGDDFLVVRLRILKTLNIEIWQQLLLSDSPKLMFIM